MRLKDKVAMISGAGGPMGFAIARRLAEEGADLVITDISGSRLDAAVAELDALPDRYGKVMARRASVIVEIEAAKLCAEALQTFGRVDVLINVVGGIADKTFFRPFLEISEERWAGTFAVNLAGTRYLTRNLAPAMLANRYGRIVNIASVDYAGEWGHADYSASKAALVSLTRVLAIEFAPHVTVNCVAPGIINTRAAAAMDPHKLSELMNRNLLKRLGEPIDVANAALFLASDESSFMTGEVMAVSGGIWPAL